MKFFLLALAIAAANAATIKDASTCTDYPCEIFYDNFDYFDHSVWEHEITATGGGNFEFQIYANNRTVSYTKNSTLYIKPTFFTETYSQPESFLGDGSFDLWGMNGKGDVCTGHLQGGCKRFADSSSDILNPFLSARLRTQQSFSFRYGTFDIRAKMPRGDYLWPAVWFLPQFWEYGLWPASGEIDLIESRGNENYDGNLDLTRFSAGTTLHWGPWSSQNRFDLTTFVYQNAENKSFHEDFHTWRMVWDETGMYFYLDDMSTIIGQFVLPENETYFDFGGFGDINNIDNMWKEGTDMAPFDRNMYIILNLAIGGTGGFFPDIPNKPYTNTSPTPRKDFWNNRTTTWLPTWDIDPVTGLVGEESSLQIDYIRVQKTKPDPVYPY